MALGAPVHVLVAGHGSATVADAAARLDGIEKALTADDPSLAAGLAEPLASLIVSLADGYDALVAPATSSGKNVMPRVAALIDVMQVSDIIAVQGSATFRRPIYAGNAVQTVEATDSKRVITIRTGLIRRRRRGRFGADRSGRSAGRPGCLALHRRGGDRRQPSRPRRGW